MKKINKVISILTVCFLLIGTGMFASFPVNKPTAVTNKEQKVSTTAAKTTTETISATEATTISKALNTAKPSGDNDLLITLLLWFFLGGLAAHRWYKGKPWGWNLLFIVTGGGCGIWAIVDLVNIIKGTF